MHIPQIINSFTKNFERCSTSPTLLRMTELFVARVITIGKSTITGLARVYGLNPYNCPWHHLFSRYRFSLWALSFALLTLIRNTFLQSSKVIVLAIDDTTCLRKGKRVFGRAKHRDGVRSSHAKNVILMGHKWLVISVVVRLPYSKRDWALPIAVGLCRSSAFARTNNQRHKTPAHIARLLIAKINRRFPDLTIIIVGDQGFGQHASAKAFSGNKLTLVSKFHPDAALYEAIKAKSSQTKGRPRIKGKRLKRPMTVVSESEAKETTVWWYGGKSRTVGLISGTGLWYRAGKGVIKVRWVYVQDKSGTHRDEYLYSTDVNLSPEQIVSLYTSRWAIEVTFQECKEHLRIEKTRVWCKNSVLHLVPMIFGFYSVIVLFYHQHQDSLSKLKSTWWPKKKTITFSDMLLAIRVYLWRQYLFLNRPLFMRLWIFKTKHEEAILYAISQVT